MYHLESLEANLAVKIRKRTIHASWSRDVYARGVCMTGIQADPNSMVSAREVYYFTDVTEACPHGILLACHIFKKDHAARTSIIHCLNKCFCDLLLPEFDSAAHVTAQMGHDIGEAQCVGSLQFFGK